MRPIVPAVILAAGGSTRMGRPKALLRLCGVPLLRWHVDRLRPHASRVVVVVGAEIERLVRLVPDTTIVVNRHWRTEHPSDSLRRALDALDVRGGCLATPVDVLPARAATLRALARSNAAVPRGPGGDGHPVRLTPAHVARLRAGPITGGLRTLLADAPRVSVADGAIASDADTPRAWAALAAAWSA